MSQDQQKSQKGQEVPNFTEDQAREFFEVRRWPNGPACPHCGSVNVYLLNGQSHRNGLRECRDCKGHFTVTVGTVMEDSHLPLSVWARAFHLMASSKKGMSALQMQRNLGLGSYRTAWFLAHRIREAMRCEPVAGMLKGEVQIDETYVGESRSGKRRMPGDPPRKHGRGTTKAPVVALVETGGKVHSRHMPHVTGANLREVMLEIVHPDAAIVTDELPAYRKAVKGFAGGHHTVNHGQGVYAFNGYHTNTAESFFAILKRGVYGSFHHVSKKHLHRYCHEFDFRWNGRELSDSERRDLAIKGSEGKRLFYRCPIGNQEPENLTI
jgi:transposase-like protein